MNKISLPLLAIMTFSQWNAHANCANSVVCTNSKKIVAVSTPDFQMQFDSSLMIQAKKTGQALEINQVKTENIYYANPMGYYAALEMGAYSVGQGAYQGQSAANFNQVLRELRTQSTNFTSEQKLLILTEAGSRLSSRYDYSLTNQPSSEELFQNARALGSQGGICGDIHHYLSEMASALGFEDAGAHTLKWYKTADKGRGHIVSHFRDPKTGLYYVQNYSRIISTNARDLATAIDVSTRIHGPLTNLSMVEGRPGVFHAYTPEVARWIYGQVDRLLGDKSGRSKIILDAGQDSAYVGIKISSPSPIGQISGFVLSKQEQTEAGKYQVSVLGVEVLQKGEMALEKNVAVGFESMARAGVLHMQAPVYSPDSSFEKFNSTSGYVEAKLMGYARINKTTGEIEFSARTVDARLKDGSAPLAHIKLRMRQDLGYNTQFEVERAYVNSRKNYDYISNIMTVESDRISVLIDGRTPGQEKAYMKFQGDYYLLEGVEARSAHAVRAQLQGVLPEKLLNGEIQVVLDVSRIISNPQNDALYRYFDSHTAASLRLAWEKEIRHQVRVGVSTEMTNGRPFHLFQQRQNQLNSNRQGREQRWMAYVRVVF